MSGILLRCAALLSASALIGTLTTAPAAADDFSRLDRDPVAGLPVVLTDGDEVDTALFSLRVADEDSVRAYALVVDEEVRPRTAYVESAWADRPEWTVTPGDSVPAHRANWVVSNSYPNVPLPVLGAASGVLFLEETHAIAATQAALWNVLDGVELDPDTNHPDVMTLYAHLVEGSADAGGGTTSPSVEVSPAQTEAVAPEEPLGPLTVSSAGEGPVRLSLRGAPASWLVDAEGEEISQAHDGDEVYLDVDPSVPAGVVTLHVRGSDVPLEEGRLFTGREGVRTQPLITAEPGSATSSTSATFTWRGEEPRGETTEEPAPETAEPEAPEVRELPSPEPVVEDTPTPEAQDRNAEGGLALTGTWLSGLLVIAGALVVSGLLILVLGRKRRD
ncbi:thioester domain-containing protein [Nocardiopsis sp. B62]|uniref:thioester domain-containing protein n=1 Tax=Nocardiopsis sp. B62 TaxID=2824874 RepID=UPI001B386772|nr:thioester domain-containing protein [Nocardiopsis sp. B62]MBQ1083576.1 Cys-Gln thioester bond-forming surface protein [Nocardiopsis sp. B62]